MKKEILQTLIVFFALLGGLCFIIGMTNYWLILGTMVFGCAAAVTKLFHNIAKD